MNVTPVTGFDWMAKCAVVLRQLRGHRLLRDRSSGLRRDVETHLSEAFGSAVGVWKN